MNITRTATALTLFIATALTAQEESYFSFYNYNMNVFNPAFAGNQESKMVALQSRRQWKAIEGSPTNVALTYSSVRKNNLGFGFSILSDQLLNQSQTQTNIDLSYRIQVAEKAFFMVGVKVGTLFFSSGNQGFVPYIPTNRSYPTSAFNSTVPNVGAGAVLMAETFWLSASIPRLMDITNSDSVINVFGDRRALFLAAGSSFEAAKDLFLKPSLIYRQPDGLPSATEITAYASWKNKIDIGAAYRTSGFYSIIALMSFNNYLVGITSEFPTGSTSGSNVLRSSEIILRLKLNNSAAKTETQE